MDNSTDKLKKIKWIIETTKCGIKETPHAYGEIEEIEASFFLLDFVDLIIYCDEFKYSELSWGAFLSNKGGYRSNLNASERIRKKFSNYDDRHRELMKLRDEYYIWRNNILESKT